MRYTVVVQNGAILWYKEGTEILHREDGPAVESKDGIKYWYQNGQLHREDGPAIEIHTGTVEYWINGNPYSEEEFKCKTAPAVELTVEEISKRLGYEVKIVKG